MTDEGGSANLLAIVILMRFGCHGDAPVEKYSEFQIQNSTSFVVGLLRVRPRADTRARNSQPDLCQAVPAITPGLCYAPTISCLPR